MFENCLSVALISAVMRASVPMPGELLLRQKLRVVVPCSAFDPFIFNASVKSGPPTGWGAEHFESPLRMLFSSVKYPALRSLGVGPAIKSWIANVATARVEE